MADIPPLRRPAYVAWENHENWREKHRERSRKPPKKASDSGRGVDDDYENIAHMAAPAVVAGHRADAAYRAGGALGQDSGVGSALGIPSAMYTPQVQQAIVGVVDALQQVKKDLALAHNRIAQLEYYADLDPSLGVYTLPAFLRQLDEEQEHYKAMQVGDVVGILGLFYIQNFEDLRLRYGLEVARNAHVALAGVVQSQLRRTDIVGTAGGASIAVLLAPTDDVQGREKMQAIQQGLRGHEWVGVATDLPDIVFQQAMLRTTEDAWSCLCRVEEKVRHAPIWRLGA
jgi:GGDEF domain-containing protein